MSSQQWGVFLNPHAKRVKDLCDAARRISGGTPTKLSAVFIAFDDAAAKLNDPGSEAILNWVGTEVTQFLAEHPRNYGNIPIVERRKFVVEKPAVSQKSESPRFSFMKKISDACRRITSLDLLMSEREDGYYFVPSKDENTAELLPRDKPVPQNAVRILSKTIGRRADVFPAEVSDRKPPKRFQKPTETPISYTAPFVGMKGKPAQTPAQTKSFAGKIIDAIRNSASFAEFQETPTVGTLATWDQLFVSFSADSACYSITVRQDSKNVSGHSVALCEVNYSVRMPGSSSPTVRTAEGFLYLPLTLGGRIRFTKDSKVVPELWEFPTQKIYLKRAKNTQKH